ncbi:hypothetical protein L218DRAFT_993130 [Marasmius fiardii PR-910]|nr:hypothetical protein L218DRAFT_993130 [Marasmius fiardii PR-910]
MSPNTWKMRRLQSDTDADTADIEAVFVHLGTPLITKASHLKQSIHDPAIGVSKVESGPIAEYLERTYSDTPTLIPDGTRALQATFRDTFMEKAPL